MSDNPLEQLQAIAGEHFENYFIMVVHPEMEMEYVYDNVYSARGLLEIVREEMSETTFSSFDIDWDDEDDEVWSDEIDDEDNQF